MIRYALQCRRDHAFEAWFRDSLAYDRQRADGHVLCPVCGDGEVRKAVMAPAVRRSSKGRAAAPEVTPPSPRPADAPTVPAVVDDPSFRIRSAIRELHARVKRDATDVGPAFPEQARAIHDGEAPPRAIYGTATNEEVRSLLDDGVGILPIPALPDDRN